MRKWIPVALIALAVLWYALNGVGSAMALSEATGNPILALTRADIRIAITQPGATPAEGEAQAVGGTGIQFGYSFAYKLPDASFVTCSHRFSFVSCDGGWMPEQAAQ